MDHRRDQGETPAGGRHQTAAADENSSCPVALLPDDVLAGILRRLPPRCLAVSRGVCAAWRAAVDARRLLRADLLPLSPGGILINFNNYYISELFSCPPADGRPAVSGKHDYLPEPGSCSWQVVRDHCNGLVLIDGTGYDTWYVLNPATRWVATLPSPPPPPAELHTYQDMYLAYDPAVSPEYEVVVVSRFLYLYKELPGRNPEIEELEWPPSVCKLQVFSSRGLGSGRRGRSLDKVGISLSSDKYHVIVKPPLETCTNCYLGKSAKGVYCASIIGRCRVQVWNLDESGCKMEWILKHDRDLRKWLLKHKLEHTRPSRYHGRAVRGPWTLQNINYHYNDHCSKDDDMVGALVEEETSVDENFTWSSDDECGDYGDYLDILGFHPCKEIIFLSEYITRGLAYDMNSSTVEVLGNIYPALYKKKLDPMG
ncbi:unnamed protein product [Urochloa decumbens]|uniref:F-box domain-containing protein n=1 Tax=Urochloa decumbens TaxID=240449 RepID=A0ABC8Y2F1_9POAL